MKTKRNYQRRSMAQSRQDNFSKTFYKALGKIKSAVMKRTENNPRSGRRRRK